MSRSLINQSSKNHKEEGRLHTTEGDRVRSRYRLQSSASNWHGSPSEEYKQTH